MSWRRASPYELDRRGTQGRCGITPGQGWQSLPGGLRHRIANRLYYAAYDAVSALLFAHGEQPQTHTGVIHLFGMLFIKPGIIDGEMGKLYHNLFTLRHTGDYDDTYSLSEEDVRPYIEPTGKLIKTVDALARSMI